MGAGRLSPSLPWELANAKWAATLNPVIGQVQGLAQQPLLQGYQVSSVALSANTPRAIAHGLGSIPSGWFLVDLNGNAVVWRQAWTAQTITLEASASVTVSIWIY